MEIERGSMSEHVTARATSQCIYQTGNATRFTSKSKGLFINETERIDCDGPTFANEDCTIGPQLLKKKSLICQTLDIGENFLTAGLDYLSVCPGSLGNGGSH